MKKFEELGLCRTVMTSLSYMKYDTPTPIQAKAIPLALDGRDIMGSAHTGTGKTATFAIPAAENLLKDIHGAVLVLTPTRELGKQVMDIFRQILGPKTQVKSTFLIGGEPMSKQLNQLQQKPRLIVGTPGRINDHLKRGTLNLEKVNFLVLDETDRMLDMGFSVQIDEILKHMPQQRQTLMFSATLPKNIMKMADKYLSKPERIAVGSTDTPAENIEQEVINVTEEGKYDELVKQLNDRYGSVIIFAKTKRNTERLAKRLKKDGHDTDCLHGDIRQNKRERVVAAFRKQKFRILVATDVASRGLDIPHIEHVINHDLPQMPEDYLHRIGRTARAGAKGQALCLVTQKDNGKWRAIQALMDPNAEPYQEERRPKRGRYNKRRKYGKPYGKRNGGFVKARENSNGNIKPKQNRQADANGNNEHGHKQSHTTAKTQDGNGFKGKGKSKFKPYGKSKPYGKKAHGSKPNQKRKGFGSARRKAG